MSQIIARLHFKNPDAFTLTGRSIHGRHFVLTVDENRNRWENPDGEIDKH
jgi:hypothetical protein